MEEIPVLYREIVIREAVYSDGLRAIVNAQAECFHPSGQPMPYQEAVTLTKARIQQGQLEQSNYPRGSVLFALFEQWLSQEFEGRLKSLQDFSCVYLDGKTSCEPDATRHSLGIRNGKSLECEPKCSVPSSND